MTFNYPIVEAAAPLPVYQRQFSCERYPRVQHQQKSIRSENYRYQPRDVVKQQHLQPRGNHDNARLERQSPVPVPQQSQNEPQNVQRNQQSQQAPAPSQSMQPAPRRNARKAEPQDNGRDDRSDSRDKGHDDRADSREKGRENENDERGHDRR